MKGSVSKDHVHLLVSIPLLGDIGRLLQRLKEKMANHLMAELARVKKQFWRRRKPSS
jgi:putative transposase